MAFNVSSITPFTDEVSQKLIKKAVLEGRTLDFVSVIPGIKYKQTLNIMTNTISPQNAVCGFSSNGSVVFTQREITVTALEVKESLCQKTLEEYFMGQWMKSGAPTENELGPILGESYVEKIKEYNEYTIWLGNVTGSSFYTPGNNPYKKFDGFCYILTGETSRVHPAAATGTTTAANSISLTDGLINNIPTAIFSRSDLILFMGYPNFLLLVQALRDFKGFFFTGEFGANMEFTYPGTNVKVVATHGLDLLDYKVLTYGENLVVGTDLMNENEQFKIWYSQDNDEVRTNIQWKLGTQIRFPEFVVTNF